MEGALFVKKMNVEKIDLETKFFSKNAFFYCENYIRKIEKSNTPLNYLDDTFSRCYSIYTDIRYRLYRKNKNSQDFIEKVMDNVENLNFKKLQKLLPLNKQQKVGFIHTLANDKERDVKWGDKNVEEE